MIQQIDMTQVYQNSKTYSSGSKDPAKELKDQATLFQTMMQAKTGGKQAVKNTKTTAGTKASSDGETNSISGQEAASAQSVQNTGAGVLLFMPTAQQADVNVSAAENGQVIQNLQAVQPQAAKQLGMVSLPSTGAEGTQQTALAGQMQPGNRNASALQMQGLPQNAVQDNSSVAAAAGSNVPPNPAAENAVGKALLSPFTVSDSKSALASAEATDAKNGVVAVSTADTAAPQKGSAAQAHTADSQPMQEVPTILDHAGTAESNSGGLRQDSSAKQEMPAAEPKTDSVSAQNSAPVSNLFHTGNVVIKVSDASSNVSQAVCSQVADKITLNYKEGNPEFEMELYPKNLGKVSVKISMENGMLTVAVLANNPKTQSMLLSSADQIQSMLQTTVNQPVQIVEPAQDKQWYEHMHNNSNQSNAQQQQEQQQEQQKKNEWAVSQSDAAKDDFMTVMQQLRMKTYGV